LPGKPNPEERPVPPEYVLAFDALFKRNCAGCHGADGKLGPAPPLNDALFRAVVDEKELKDVISKGRRSAAGRKDDPRTPMPAFLKENGGTLSAEQIRVLVYEIKGIPYRLERESEAYDAKVEVLKEGEKTTLRQVDKVEPRSPTWGIPPSLAKDTPPYLASKKGDSKRGAKVFDRACMVCHAENGKGFTKDDRLVKRINDPAFLGLISDRALRRIAITGRPDLGMPNYAERGPNRERGDFKPLTADEITDLVAFLASWRREGVARGK